MWYLTRLVLADLIVINPNNGVESTCVKLCSMMGFTVIIYCSGVCCVYNRV